MGRGRPRKSQEQHATEGTYRHDRHDQLHAPSEQGAPVMPRGLDSNGKWLWKLVVRNWMKEIDTPALIQLCEAWSLYRRAYEKANENPFGSGVRAHFATYSNQFNSLACKFGLNPTDRANINLPKDNQDDEKKKTDEEYFGIVSEVA